MISAKDAWMKSQSEEVKEKIRKEQEAHNKFQLDEIEKMIESTIARNETRAFYHRSINKYIQDVLESKGYVVQNTNPNFSGTTITWSDPASNEPNNILKEVIQDKPKKKKWFLW